MDSTAQNVGKTSRNFEILSKLLTNKALLPSSYAQRIILLKLLLDSSAIIFSIYSGYIFGIIFSPSPQNYGYPPLELILFFCLILIITFHAVGLYAEHRSIMNIKETQKILHGVFLGFLIIFSSSRLLRWAGYFLSPKEIIYIFSQILILINIERYLLFKLDQRLMVQGKGVQRLLIYGTEMAGKFLAKVLQQSPKLGNIPVGFIGNKRQVGQRINGIMVLGTIEQLSDIVRKHQINVLFIAKSVNPSTRILPILDLCNELKLRVRVILPDYTWGAHKMLIEDIGGIPFMGIKEDDVGFFTLWIKRLLDIVISLVGLAVIGPMFLLLVLLIRLDSKGPAIFTQLRAGQHGQLFKMYKFRTMYNDCSPYAHTPKDAHDARVTRLGKFLRRTSLDELPQLFNVLKGDMSLVGPRPEMPFIVKDYDPLQRERLRVKPGVTGLWQISADRGSPIHANIEYDLYYVENQSLLLDFAIIIRTIIATLKGLGAH